MPVYHHRHLHVEFLEAVESRCWEGEGRLRSPLTGYAQPSLMAMRSRSADRQSRADRKRASRPLVVAALCDLPSHFTVASTERTAISR